MQKLDESKEKEHKTVCQGQIYLWKNKQSREVMIFQLYYDISMITVMD